MGILASTAISRRWACDARRSSCLAFLHRFSESLLPFGLLATPPLAGRKTKRPDQKYGNGQEIGFSIFDGAVMIDLWNDPMETRCKEDPKWWHTYIVVKDVFLGRADYSTRILKTSRVKVPMPEANYSALR